MLDHDDALTCPLSVQISRYLDWLEALPAVDDNEATLAQKALAGRVLEFLAREPAPFHRETLHGHVTGSALLLDSTLSHMCLLHHAKLDRWLQPGGHSDGDARTDQVALREATEETGLQGLRLQELVPGAGLFPIDIDIHALPARGMVPAHTHFDLRYLVVAPRSAAAGGFVRNAESHDVRWIPALDVASGNLAFSTDESVRRLARKAKAIRLVLEGRVG